MDARKPELRCPKCLSRDTPILVVWGTGIDSGRLDLQCRACRHQWSAERLDSQAS